MLGKKNHFSILDKCTEDGPLLAECKKVKETTNSKNYHTIYQVVSGSNPDTWLWEYPINSMEELNMSTGAGGASDMKKVLGDEGAKEFWELYRNTYREKYGTSTFKFRSRTVRDISVNSTELYCPYSLVSSISGTVWSGNVMLGGALKKMFEGWTNPANIYILVVVLSLIHI